MEITAGHHMNFPWSTTMAMVFYRIFMVTMVFHGSYCNCRFLYECSMERNACHGVLYDLHGTHGIFMEYHQIHHAGFMQKYTPWVFHGKLM